MSEKTIMTRISLDIPVDYHKHLKAIAALQRKTLRQLILESVDICIAQRDDKTVPIHERWIYDPANKAIVEHIQKGLKQKATIYRGSFSRKSK